MQLMCAYCAVLFIWATTPLGIKWSNSGLSFSAAVCLRMVLALVLCAGILFVQKKRLIQSSKDWYVFAVGAMGLFPNMLIVYWSAQYIPSGLVSLLLGFFPLFLGVFSWLLLPRQALAKRQIIALGLAFCGFVIIYAQQVSVTVQGFWAVLGVLVAAAIWALSSLWVKNLGGEIEPMRHATGTLFIAAPLFFVCWLLFDRQIPQQWLLKSQVGVGYLAVAGSCLGYTLYFYVLRHCSLAATGLLTLLSPPLALAVGFCILGEVLSLHEQVGIFMVILALAIYSGAINFVGRIYIKTANSLIRGLGWKVVRRYLSAESTK